MSARGWTPVLRGGTFCSPGCGAGCLKSDYDKAVRDAAALAKLLGKGFRPNVWENMGWHYEVVKGKIEVHAHPSLFRDGPDYTVYLQTSPQFILSGKSPRKLVKRAAGELRKHILELIDDLREAES